MAEMRPRYVSLLFPSSTLFSDHPVIRHCEAAMLTAYVKYTTNKSYNLTSRNSTSYNYGVLRAHVLKFKETGKYKADFVA
jgi:hypothetical protein